MMLRLPGRLLVCALIAAVSACQARGGGSVLRIADLANPTSLNPLLAHDQETIGNDLLVVQTLTGLDEHNREVPLLLARMPRISRDRRRIVYRLRRGVRFADGVELTSADVAFTFRAIADTRNPVLSQDSYRRIASLTAPDRYTVIVNLKRPWNAAVNDLFAQSDFAFGILPAHAFKSTALQGADWENHAFGTGPYRVVQWRRGDRIELAANPYFSPKPKIERIELRMIPSANTASLALRSGEVDIAPLDTPQAIALAMRARGITVVRTPLNGTEWITVQTTAPGTSGAAVRRAIAGSIDMRSVAKTFGSVYPEAASFLPPVMRGFYDSSVRPYVRAALPAYAGELTLVIQGENPLWTRIATTVQQDLDRAGFRVTIKTFPTALFNAPDGPIRNGRFTLAIDGWLGGGDPEQSIVFTCAQAGVNGDNISRFCDPRFEALFADQAVTRDSARRRADFMQMQRIVHENAPVIPLYYMTWFDGVNRRVRGFARNMLQYPVAPETWSLAR
ncbi:MAG: ABC transporter substrate-binding protein [Candidatus Baltobacteraceae bacterium]